MEDTVRDTNLNSITMYNVYITVLQIDIMIYIYILVDDTMIVPPSRLEVVQRPARVAEVPGESYFVIGCDDFSLEHPFQCPTLSYPAGFFAVLIYLYGSPPPRAYLRGRECITYQVWC